MVRMGSAMLMTHPKRLKHFKVVQVHYAFAIRFSSILFFPYFYHVPTILVNHKQVVIRHS